MSFLKIKGHTDTKTDLTCEMLEARVLRCRYRISGGRGKPCVFLYELIQKHHMTK